MQPLDLDSIVDAVLPWDLQVQVQGVTYKTRRANVGEVGAISALAKPQMTDEESAKLQLLIDSLFVDAAPPANAWSAPLLIAFLNAYVQYMGTRGDPKKFGAVAAAARQAVTAPPQAPAN
jgi:hypothetical protein